MAVPVAGGVLPPAILPARGARRAESTVVLPASAEACPAFEDFVDSLAFLASRERARLRLAGGEILDNLVRHAAPLERDRLSIRAAKRPGGIVLAFFFRSPSFASFAARCSDPEPLFDPVKRRWRGIGMVMCRNLSSRVRLRPGERLDRIFLSFPHDSD